jgi:hypothetical protein
MSKKVKCCTLFLYVSFYLKVSHKVFNETIRTMQLTNVMYSFIQELFFRTRFSDEVFNEVCAYHGNRLRECCKTCRLYPERKGKGEGEILILVRLYVGLYQTLRPWQSYIYMGVVRCNYQYSKQ